MQNTRTTRKPPLALLALGLISAGAMSAQAQITYLYTTDFNAPTYSDTYLDIASSPTGVLNTGADTTTPGQDGWLTSSGGSSNAIKVSNTATNGFVSLTTSGQDIRRLFTGVTAGSSVWFDADIKLSAAQATGDYAIHLGDGTTTNFYARTYFKSSGAGYVMALGTGSGAATYGTTVLDFGTTYKLLVRYDIISGTANDTGALFINPTSQDGTLDAPYVAATTIGTDATTISSFSFRQGTASSAPTMTVDNVRVFTSVPEPGTISALLGGFALLGLSRRRQRA